eukprot:Gb_29299 [translate_table: standard]
MAPEVPPEGFTGKVATLNSNEYSKRAYVTFLAGSGDYVKGVIGLAKGLRKVKSSYPLVVAVLPDVPQDHRSQLHNQGCIVHEIEPINPPENQVQFAMAYYVLNYSKLRIWEYKIGYCQQCPDKVQWPLELGQPPALYFNAGMFVFEPSKLTFESLMETLMVTTPTAFAEQDFLNMFFQKMYRPIPLVYNLVLAMLWRHPENVGLERVKVVHYCAAGSKPWRFTGKEENMEREDIKRLVEKWWDIYNDSSLDFKPTDRIPEAETRSDLQQRTANSLRAAMPRPVNIIPAPPAA